jgi:plasmid stability protein
MADLRVRRLDDEVVLLLKDRAKREGTSVEAILRKVISEEAKRPRREMVARLRERHEAFQAAHGYLPDSTEIIREERDRWS